jgi:hypothetical protein
MCTSHTASGYLLAYIPRQLLKPGSLFCKGCNHSQISLACGIPTITIHQCLWLNIFTTTNEGEPDGMKENLSSIKLYRSQCFIYAALFVRGGSWDRRKALCSTTTLCKTLNLLLPVHVFRRVVCRSYLHVHAY